MRAPPDVLRITFLPVTWLVVLNRFALSLTTYLIFYVAVAFLVNFLVILLWGFFRVFTNTLSSEFIRAPAEKSGWLE